MPRAETDKDILSGWLEDAAHYPGGASQEVFFPSCEAEIAAILDRGQPCLAVGAQSSLTGGATPHGESLIAFSQMNAMDLSGGIATCGGGVVLADLIAYLDGCNAYYPPVPTYDGATIGGNVATNAAGAATFRHGTTREWVAGLNVVTAWGEVLDIDRGRCRAGAEGRFRILSEARGEIVFAAPEGRRPELPKNSSGYYGAPGMDLVDLFIGAEGTLGVVTEVRLRTVSPRPNWFVALVAVADDAAAVALTHDLRELAKVGVAVSAIEYMDRACVSLLREDGIAAREGLRLDGDAGAYLLVQVELPADYDQSSAYAELAEPSANRGTLSRVATVLGDHGLLDEALPALPSEASRRAALFAVREAVPEGVNRRVAAAKQACDGAVSKCGGDVIVPFHRFEEGLRTYRQILDRAGLQHATWGHISDGNVHPNVLATNADEMAAARAAQREIGLAAIELGGAPMAEHGVGRNAVKQDLLAAFHGPKGVASMKAVRSALDPNGVFAPGVLWPNEPQQRTNRDGNRK